jgi:hypothetical protein
MEEWYVNIFKALICGTIISFIISVFTSGATSYNSSIAGFSILILSIMMILTMIITKVLKTTLSNSSTTQLMITILSQLGPFLLMLLIISFILYLTVTYKTPILENHISPNYHTFSNITIILILVQLSIVYTNIFTKEFISSGKLQPITSAMLYAVGILSVASTIIIYIILKYFRTDGFQISNI